MKKPFSVKNLLYLGFILILFSCDSKQDIERPRDPWVFRSVLDKQARMITVALHDNLYVAYDVAEGGLYKAWKGGVVFDGAVYTSVHGPQPTSTGYAYYSQKLDEPNWRIIKNGNKTIPRINFKGYRFEEDQVTFTFHLVSDGDTIVVRETPEYINRNENPGLSRTFITENVPENAQVAIETSLTSLENEDDYETDGEFEIENTSRNELNDGETITLEGTLVLKSNASTVFKTYFHPGFDVTNPENATVAAEESPLEKGYTLIENSDCKTCHNETKKTIGPAYVAVAEKYDTSEGTISTLANKVIKGGSGNWGEVVMNPHPDLMEEDARLMIRYILSLAEEKDVTESEMDFSLGVESIPLNLDTTNRYLEEGEEGELLPGLAANLYVFDDFTVPFKEISANFPPILSGVVPAIHVLGVEDMGERKQNIYMEFKGYIQIDQTDNYVFRIISDDGGLVYINGRQVIDNGGNHGAMAKDAELYLEKGLHEIEIDYHQGAGGGMVSFQWVQHGEEDFSIVPNEVLFHKKDQFKEVVPYIPMEKLARSIPGDKKPVAGVHPAFDLSQARPDDFHPRVGGMDFLSDGRMVVCTWDSLGPVYILDGVASGDPKKIKVKRIAAGLAEPLGIKVVDDQIFVLQKQELTQLIDHDGDEIIDEYRTVCDGWRVSANFHEFAFGLVYKDGFFYAALATAIEPGGASTNPQIPDRGKVIKINKDDGSFEFVAYGLRTPNGIGIGVDNEIFIADNQGDWLPASKIVHLKEGAFYGSRSVDFEGTANLEAKLPVVWLTQDEIGNSPSQPVYINVGPYKGQMIHGEVTHGGIKRDFVEKVNGEYQGAVFRFTQGLEAGVNRLVWGPDGALYIGGVGSTGNWVHAGKLWYGLQRLNYNGKSAFEMLSVSARSNGMEVTFTEPIAKNESISKDNFEVLQWYFKPTADYGGPKLGEETLAIKSVNLSNDRKKVFLELEGMKPEHVVYVRISKAFMSDKNQSLWSTEAWYTLNAIPENKPGLINPVRPQPDNTLSDAEKAAGWELLFDGKTTNGWRKFKGERAGSAWKVSNGALYLDNSKKEGWQTVGGGDIITEREYQNYELTLDWKIERGGNSGLIYNVVEDDKYDYVWQTGPEFQMLDNLNHPDGRIEKHRSGDLYDLIESRFVSVNTPGVWNSIKLVSKDGHVEHWQNGYKIVETEMHTAAWDELVKNSKFKDMPDFGKAKKGHVSLQDHGDKIWFKNIKIRPL